MKKNLFRGILKADNLPHYHKGQWVYGDYVRTVDGKRIIPHIYGCGEIEPGTEGQYIGLDDKNGKEIYEGDIVHAVYKSGYIGIPDKDFGIGVVRYNGTHYGGAAYQIDIVGEPGCRIFSASLQVEIIGNIHDNPDLLEVSM